jgi:hydrogenase-4 membrane subunit HyfE
VFVLREVRRKQEVESVLPQRFVFLLAIGLVLVAYYVAGPITTLDGLVTRNALPTAVSLLLIGLFIMLIRKKTLSQILGLVVMENGLYLLAVLATQGLPLAVELGVTVDVVVGVLVMGLVSRHIHRAFDTIDTDQLRTLRG